MAVEISDEIEVEIERNLCRLEKWNNEDPRYSRALTDFGRFMIDYEVDLFRRGLKPQAIKSRLTKYQNRFEALVYN